MPRSQTEALLPSQEAAAGYVIRWNRLVSSTNWEKGRIIHEWRQALAAGGASVQEYSDEAWSRAVGGVSSQHVGRLRRVYDRFDGMRETFPDLYWSHYQAAVDWADAEMWLEGAVQNGWSVMQMRTQRWEAQGAPKDQQPREDEITAEELEGDDLPPVDDFARSIEAPWDAVPDDGNSGPNRDERSDFGDESEATGGSGRESAHGGSGGEGGSIGGTPAARGEALRPFADLPELPADMAEGWELLKLSILRHKLAGWSEVSADDVVRALQALQQFALAPPEGAHEVAAEAL